MTRGNYFYKPPGAFQTLGEPQKKDNQNVTG